MGRGGKRKARAKARRKAAPSVGGTTRRWFLKVASSPWAITVLGGVVVRVIERALLPPVSLPQHYVMNAEPGRYQIRGTAAITLGALSSTATGIVRGPTDPTLTV